MPYAIVAHMGLPRPGNLVKLPCPYLQEKHLLELPGPALFQVRCKHQSKEISISNDLEEKQSRDYSSNDYLLLKGLLLPRVEHIKERVRWKFHLSISFKYISVVIP